MPFLMGGGNVPLIGRRAGALAAAGGGGFDVLSALDWHAAYWASDPEWTPPAEGTAVTTWRDGSGNGRTATGDLSTGPVFRGAVAELNGQPALDFATKYLSAATGTLAQPNTVVAVYAVDTTGTHVLADGMTDRHLTRVMSGTTPNLYAGTALAATAAAAVGSACLLVGIYNGAASEIHLNGAAAGTGTVNTQSWGPLQIGAQTAGTGYLDGKLAFLGMLNRVATAEEMADLATWAADWYGVPV